MRRPLSSPYNLNAVDKGLRGWNNLQSSCDSIFYNSACSRTIHLYQTMQQWACTKLYGHMLLALHCTMNNYTVSCHTRCTFNFNVHISWGCVYMRATCREPKNRHLKLVPGVDSNHMFCCSYISCCSLPLYIHGVPGDVVGEGEMAVAWSLVGVVPRQSDVTAVNHRVTKYGRSSCGW